jgi:hypothetical protein
MPERRWPRHPRTVQGAWFAIEDIREAIDDMAVADEVAERVDRALSHRRTVRLTLTQKVLATLVAAITAADLIYRLFHGG